MSRRIALSLLVASVVFSSYPGHAAKYILDEPEEGQVFEAYGTAGMVQKISSVIEMKGVKGDAAKQIIDEGLKSEQKRNLALTRSDIDDAKIILYSIFNVK